MPLRSDPGRLPGRNHYQEGPDAASVPTRTQGPAPHRPPSIPAGSALSGHARDTDSRCAARWIEHRRRVGAQMLDRGARDARSTERRPQRRSPSPGRSRADA